MRRAAVIALAVLPALGLAACESTQDKSAKLKAEGRKVLQEKGLTLERTNTDVRVLSRQVLHDQYGNAVVAELENTTSKPMANVPLALAVKGPGGKVIFRNNAPGLQPALVSVPLLLPHQK